jgi:hypothetical protein
MESRIGELVVEGDDLRKVNEAFLSDDNDYMEEMDMEPDADTDDDDFINDEEDPEIVISEQEEDLEEPPFIKDDAPQASVYHVVDIADD